MAKETASDQLKISSGSLTMRTGPLPVEATPPATQEAKKSEMDRQFEKPDSTRKHKFLELFAGKAGLSREVRRRWRRL